MIDPKLLSDIQQAEGLSLTAYKDTVGVWTIGWGHAMADQNHDWTGYQINTQQATDLLSVDIQEAVDAAETTPEWNHMDTQCRQNALTELVFNMGLTRWKGFVKARLDMIKADWQGVHDELLNSKWATQVGKRATRIANYMLTGQYA